jgi:hypothetical protein
MRSFIGATLFALAYRIFMAWVAANPASADFPEDLSEASPPEA